VVSGNSGDGYARGEKKEALSRSPNVAGSGRNRGKKIHIIAQYCAWKKRKEAGAGQKGREPRLKVQETEGLDTPVASPAPPLPTANDVKAI